MIWVSTEPATVVAALADDRQLSLPLSIACLWRPEWLTITECRRRLGVPQSAVERAITDGLVETRWRGGLLRANGKRSQRVRLVELDAMRAALSSTGTLSVANRDQAAVCNPYGSGR